LEGRGLLGNAGTAAGVLGEHDDGEPSGRVVLVLDGPEVLEVLLERDLLVLGALVLCFPNEKKKKENK